MQAPVNDNSTAPPPQPASWQPMADLIMALRFYSRLPTGSQPHAAPDLNRIAVALPIASLVIGIGPAVLLAVAVWLRLPPLFAASLAVVLAVALTGAMAEDALADAADGLFGGVTLARRLEIMKDSRHGTYGVAALCLLLLLRVSALAAMATAHPLAAAAGWLAATILARSGALWLSYALPAARADGASASAGRVTRPALLKGLILALVLAAIIAGPVAGPGGLVAVAVLAIATIAGWTMLCRRLVGGQTGDLIGALQALLEIAALTGMLFFF